MGKVRGALANEVMAEAWTLVDAEVKTTPNKCYLFGYLDGFISYYENRLIKHNPLSDSLIPHIEIYEQGWVEGFRDGECVLDIEAGM